MARVQIESIRLLIMRGAITRLPVAKGNKMTAVKIPRLIDEPTAAETADVSLATFKRLRREGRGPDYVMVGRQIKYSPAALERWISAHTIKADRTR